MEYPQVRAARRPRRRYVRVRLEYELRRRPTTDRPAAATVTPEARMALWSLFRKPRRRPELRVVMYTRAGCHLCDDAWALLQAAQREYGFALEAQDVDADPALAADHGLCVPVVAVDGKVRFRGRVNPVLLRRLLEAGGGAEAE